jgi:hypothetical protein
MASTCCGRPARAFYLRREILDTTATLSKRLVVLVGQARVAATIGPCLDSVGGGLTALAVSTISSIGAFSLRGTP